MRANASIVSLYSKFLSFVKINVIEIVLSCFLIFKIKETKDYVTSPRAWTCDFLLPFYVISLYVERVNMLKVPQQKENGEIAGMMRKMSLEIR